MVNMGVLPLAQAHIFSKIARKSTKHLTNLTKNLCVLFEERAYKPVHTNNLG